MWLHVSAIFIHLQTNVVSEFRYKKCALKGSNYVYKIFHKMNIIIHSKIWPNDMYHVALLVFNHGYIPKL
jgi:hypothetical protein